MKKYFQAPWNAQDLAIIAGSIIILALAVTGVGYIFRSNFEHGQLGSLYFLVFFFLQWLVIFTPLLILTQKKYKLGWSKFGFAKYSLWKSIGLIIAAYFLNLAINIIISMIVIYGNIKIPGYEMQESVFKLFGGDLASIILSGVIVILIAPLVEEIFFRGFLLRALANRAGNALGSIITALIFALLHFPWQSIIPVFILGLIINSLVIRTKSIWPAIGFHIFNNSIAFTILLLLEKGIIPLEKL